MQSKENKNIDQLFKDRLQGMESTPPPVVWENIQEALGHKKQDRKVIPLWWKLSGVAAALVLLFSVANMLMTDNPEGLIKDNNQLVNEESVKSSTDPVDTEKSNSANSINNSDALVSAGHEQEGDAKAIVSSVNSDEDTKLVKNNTSTSKTILKFNTNNNSSTGIANATNETSKTIVDNTINTNTAVTNTIDNSTLAKTAESDMSTIKNNRSLLPKTENNPKKETITSITKEAVAAEEINESKTSIDGNTTIDKKENIFDVIAEQKEAVAITTNELPTSRWAISPNVAPVYYSSLSQGSSIDSTFVDNTKNGDVNVSYGINVSYAVSPRLTIRSGISKVNVSYATGGLELATGDASAALQSINYANEGIVVTAVDQGVLNSNQGDGNPYANLTRKATEGDVFLTQSISYTEIPTELTYKLLDKRFGINVIGGFSTLLLGNNEVSVFANDFNDVIGEANNLSDVSFSTNVGLGVSYQLTKKFNFNIEPVFKYQLNPYTDTSVQFKPYYVGVYSGLSFKF